jgi:hypothetical protein
MTKRARSFAFFFAVLGVSTAAAVTASRSAQIALTVHEWGTFTSVAGQDGQSVNWTPLSGPQDLPCFVDRPPLLQVKGRDVFGLLKTQPGVADLSAPARALAVPAVVPPPLMAAKVRMETPVLYFYAPQRVTVGVKVSFNQGVMSEWYPRALVPLLNLSRPLATTVGTIEWPAVRVLPDANVSYPQDSVKSHYYAARDVDAASVEVGTQYEKFLFYRGLADFQPPFTATASRDGSITAMMVGAMPKLVLFENRHGHTAYRIARGTTAQVTLTRPTEGTVDELRADLEAMLTAEGLYAREAKAMVETWRDSWFEEGERIFYILPKASIDERLPLTITGTPASITRVFVGRLELITPEMKKDVEQAIRANDLDALNAYGRFLDVIAMEMANDGLSNAISQRQLENALRAVALSHPQPKTCQ